MLDVEIEVEQKFEKKYKRENVYDYYSISKILIDEILVSLHEKGIRDTGVFKMYTEFYRVIYDGRTNNRYITVRILEPGMIFYLHNGAPRIIMTSKGRVEIKIPVFIGYDFRTIEYKTYFDATSTDYKQILYNSLEELIKNKSKYKVPENIRLPKNPKELANDITSRWVIDITQGKPNYRIINGGYVIRDNVILSIYSGEREIICKNNNNRLKFVDLEIEFNLENLDKKLIYEISKISSRILEDLGFQRSNKNMAHITYELCK